MKFSEIHAALNVSKQTLVNWLKQGRLGEPIPGTSPAQWDIDQLRERLLRGDLTLTPRGKRRKQVA